MSIVPLSALSAAECAALGVNIASARQRRSQPRRPARRWRHRVRRKQVGA